MFEPLLDLNVLSTHDGATLVHRNDTSRIQLFRVRDGQQDVAIKHQRYEQVKRQLKLLWRGTPAAHEYASIRRLHAAGIPTVEPLALVIRRRWGLLPAESFMVTRWADAAPAARIDPLGLDVVRAVVEVVRRLFQAGLYPTDLNASNVLIARDADGRPRPLVMDQPEVREAAPMDPDQITACVSRFYTGGNYPNSWGLRMTGKWLAAMMARLDLPVERRRAIWRKVIVHTRGRMQRLLARHQLAEQNASFFDGRWRGRIQRAVLKFDELQRMLAEHEAQRAGRPVGQWFDVAGPRGRRWRMIEHADAKALRPAWARAVALWFLLAPGPHPGAWMTDAATGRQVLILEQPDGTPLAQWLAGAADLPPAPRVDALDQLRRELARLMVRLRRGGRQLAPEQIDRLTVVERAGRPLELAFDGEVELPPRRAGNWAACRQRLGRLGGPIDDSLLDRLAGDLRRAARLSRWMLI